MQRLTKYTLANPEFIKPDSFNLSGTDYVVIRANCLDGQRTNVHILANALFSEGRSYEYIQKRINNEAKKLEDTRIDLVSKAIYKALQTGSIFKSNGSHNLSSESTIKTTVIRSDKYCVYIDIPRASIYITTSENTGIDFIPIRDTGLIESFCKLMTI